MIIKKASHLRQSAKETKDLILRGTTPIHNTLVLCTYLDTGTYALYPSQCNGGFSVLSYSSIPKKVNVKFD